MMDSQLNDAACLLTLNCCCFTLKASSCWSVGCLSQRLELTVIAHQKMSPQIKTAVNFPSADQFWILDNRQSELLDENLHEIRHNRQLFFLKTTSGWLTVCKHDDNDLKSGLFTHMRRNFTGFLLSNLKHVHNTRRKKHTAGYLLRLLCQRKQRVHVQHKLSTFLFLGWRRRVHAPN